MHTYIHTIAQGTQRSKSLHTSPLNDGEDSDDDDNKLKLTRRSSDTTSPTLLSDNEDEVVRVVKRDFQVCSDMYVCLRV